MKTWHSVLKYGAFGLNHVLDIEISHYSHPDEAQLL
jgi:hypothetical protein